MVYVSAMYSLAAKCMHVVVVACAIYSVVHLFWKMWTSAYAQFPGPRTYPLIGNVLEFESEPHKVAMQFDAWLSRFGTPYVVWLGPTPMVFCGAPDHAETILSSQTATEKSSMTKFLNEWLGDGLLLSSGEKWKRLRYCLTPAFHFSALSNYREMVYAKSKALVRNLLPFADENKVVDIQIPVSPCSLDIICEAAMGVSCKAQEKESSEYVQAILAIARCAFHRMRFPYLWPDIVFRSTAMGKNYYRMLNCVHSYTRRVILKRMEERAKRAEDADIMKSRGAFLDLLLDLHASGRIDTDEVCEEVDTFMFAGHDTTSSAISWTLYLLGRNLDIQEKVWQEIDCVLDGGKKKFAEIDNNLKYLECVIKESMRLYPPVPVVARNIQSKLQFKGFSIPKGTQLGILIHQANNDSNFWPNPAEFVPERFLADTFSKRHPFQYVPFSAGPRNCIGQRFAMLELKIVLANVLRHFKITSMQGPEEIQITRQLVSRSSNGLMLQLSRRSDAGFLL